MAHFLKNIFTRNTKGALVLMYHRIADSALDPWDLSVSPENFESHIRYLQQHTEVIPLQELIQRIYTRQSLYPCIALTFDDGYLDNYTQAKPLLEKYTLPATFFFTTKFQSNDKAYWWDELEQMILVQSVLPEKLSLTLAETSFSFALGEARVLTTSLEKEIRAWRYGKPLYNARLRLFHDLWSILKPASITDQQTILQALRSWSGNTIFHTPPVMNEYQIRDLSRSPLLEIGAHTANHPALGFLPPDAQRAEMQQSKNILEQITGKVVTGIAYPYGSLNKDTPVIAQVSGFQYAVSTHAQVVSARMSIYDIPRIQVTNQAPEAFSISIKRWQRNQV